MRTRRGPAPGAPPAAPPRGGGAAAPPLSLADLPESLLAGIVRRVRGEAEEPRRRDLGALRACCAATRAAVDALGAGQLRARRAHSLLHARRPLQRRRPPTASYACRQPAPDRPAAPSSRAPPNR